MAVELHQRHKISYKLQRRQLKGKDNPYWHPARLDVVTHAIRFLHSWHATVDKISQTDLLRGCVTVWASVVKISEIEQKVNTYLTDMSRFLWENSLLITAPKSSVTLFTLYPAQPNTHPKIKIADSELPLVRSPKILGVYLDTLFSFNNHSVQVANRVSKRNNVLKALSGIN